MARICIYLFGSPHIDAPDGTRLFDRPPGATALLAYLLLHPHAISRDLLTSELWSELAQDRARRCLNTALWRLRQALEPDGVPRGRYLVTGPTGAVEFRQDGDTWIDVCAFEHCLRRLLVRSAEELGADDIRDWYQALALHSGPLLVGFDQEWAEAERQRLGQLRTEALIGLMRAHHARGESRQAVTLGTQVLAEDPLREDVHQELMAVYLETGQRTLALRQYETCRRLLREELGASPLAYTQELFRRSLADGMEPARVPASRLGSARRPGHVQPGPAAPQRVGAPGRPDAGAPATPAEIADADTALRASARAFRLSCAALRDLVSELDTLAVTANKCADLIRAVVPGDDGAPLEWPETGR
jgi:DNA-binding SARP family transcriptional activator